MASTSTDPQQIPAGLELIFDLEKGNITKLVDAFQIAFHWAIIRAGLRVKIDDGTTTERLPEGWSSSDSRLIDYIDPLTPTKTYKIKIVDHIPNKSIIIAVDVFIGDEPVRNSQGPVAALTSIELANYIAPNYESIETAYTNPRQLEEKIWSTIMEPVGLHVTGKPPILGPYENKTKTKAELQAEAAEQRRNNPPPIPDYYYPQRPLPAGPPGGFGPLYVPPVGGPGGLGRSDLDPLGHFGAGNVADPRGFRRPQIGNQGLPPGVVPPGARFDPFGPVMPNRPFAGAPPQAGRGRGGPNWAVPDPDNEQPPPGWDDMFM